MKNYFNYCILILLIGCTDSNEINYEKKVIQEDSIVIDVPSSIPKFNSSEPWSLNQGKFSFSYEKQNASTIYTYDFYDESWSSKKYTHPDGNGIISDAHFILSDSLNIFNPVKAKNNLLFFKNDSLAKKVKLNDVNKLVNDYSFLPELDSKNHFQVKDKKLFFPVLTTLRMEPENLKERKLFGIYDLEKHRTSFYGSFPKNFTDYSNLLINNIKKNIAIGKSNILINFPKLPFLLVYNQEGKFIKKVNCQNDNIVNLELIDSNAKVKQSVKNYLSGNYNKVVYNQQKNVFYRVSTYFKGYKKLSLKQLTKKGLKLKRTRIHVLNDDFETIAINDFKGLNESFIALLDNELLIMSGYDQPDKLIFKRFQLSN